MSMRPNPADRFVYINMRKYKEGNTLQEGPSLGKDPARRCGAQLSRDCDSCCRGNHDLSLAGEPLAARRRSFGS